MNTNHTKTLAAASLVAGMLSAPLASATPLLFDPDPSDATPGVRVDQFQWTARNFTNSADVWPVMVADANANNAIDVGETGTERLAWILQKTIDLSTLTTTSYATTPGVAPGAYNSSVFMLFDLGLEVTSVTTGTGGSPLLEWKYTGVTMKMYRDDDGTFNGGMADLDQDALLAEFAVTGVDGGLTGTTGVQSAGNLQINGEKVSMLPNVFQTLGGADISGVPLVFQTTTHHVFSDPSAFGTGSAVNCDGTVCMVALNGNPLGESGNQNQISTITVPEPATLGLLGLGFMGLGAASRRRRSA